jgi:Ca2+-binding EF-hand superfamily protein
MKSLVLASVLLLSGAPAFGQTPAQSIAWLDLDKDGHVSLNEYLTFQASRLPQFDLNGNGRLSRAEFESSLVGPSKANAERSFRIFDANKDNALDQREFLGYHAFVFKNYVDTDKDGFLSLAELSALQEAVK